MTRALSFHPDIFYEVNDAYTWYEVKSSGLGKQFITELENAFELIKITPLYWAKFSGRFRKYLLKRFPFGVIYRVEKSEIYVVAIMHLSRKPGYWKKRITK
jgi:hypothetical protein